MAKKPAASKATKSAKAGKKVKFVLFRLDDKKKAAKKPAGKPAAKPKSATKPKPATPAKAKPAPKKAAPKKPAAPVKKAVPKPAVKPAVKPAPKSVVKPVAAKKAAKSAPAPKRKPEPPAPPPSPIRIPIDAAPVPKDIVEQLTRTIGRRRFRVESPFRKPSPVSKLNAQATWDEIIFSIVSAGGPKGLTVEDLARRAIDVKYDKKDIRDGRVTPYTRFHNSDITNIQAICRYLDNPAFRNLYGYREIRK